MNKLKAKFKLIGFINPYCVLPAFVYPVFMYSKQYYFEDGRGYRIKDFAYAGEHLWQNHLSLVEDSRLYSVGDETIFAYQTQKGNIKYGNDKIMHEFLSKICYQNTNISPSLLDEIDSVQRKLISVIQAEDRITLCNKKSIRGRKRINYVEPLKSYSSLHYARAKEMAPCQNEHRFTTTEPSKALIGRTKLTYRKLESHYYASILHQYTQSLTEFYELYKILIEASPQLINQFQLNDFDSYSSFIKIILLQNGENFHKKDLLVLYKNLYSQNTRRFIPQESFGNEKALRLAVRIVRREVKRQKILNELLFQIIDSSPHDTGTEIDMSQLDIKYLQEEV